MATKIVHPIEPVFDNESAILILGSFPSVKSREYGFFYGHPQNRFWRVLANIFDCAVPVTIDEKKALLLSHHIALWDVIHSCEIEGSADSTIKNAVPNDLQMLLENSKITKIFTNGSKADALYQKYLQNETGIVARKLPSTSPANAAWSLEKLCTFWSKEILG